MANYTRDTQGDDSNLAPMTLPSGWPDVSGEWKTSPSRIEDFAGQLAGGKTGDPVTDVGAAMKSVAGAGLDVGDVGDSPAGRALAETIRNTHGHITTVYQAFLADYEAAVELLRTTAKSHGSALEATYKTVHHAGTEVSESKVPTIGSVASVLGRKGLD